MSQAAEHYLNNSPYQIRPIEVREFIPLDHQTQSKNFTVSLKLIALVLVIAIGLSFFAFTYLARAVIFSTQPENAKLEVSSWLSFNIGENYLLLPGKHKVEASADGYLNFDGSINVSDEKNQRLPLVLDPIPGIFTFSSKPSDAEIWLKDQKLGNTGEKISGLPLGQHTFFAKKARYLDQTLNVDIKGYGEEQTLEFLMEPAWGTRSINSIPTNAKVVVDGIEVGNTPLDIEILNTGSKVVIEAKRYEPWQQVLLAEPQSTGTLPSIELEKVYTTFAVTSSPNGANVTFNGVFEGNTPLKISAPSDTEHNLKLFSQGYQTVSTKITGESGKASELNYTLKPVFGEVSLRVSPQDAEVYINGKRFTGNLSKMTLPAKAQKILIKKPGYVSEEKIITPKQTGTQVYTFELFTPEDAHFAEMPKIYSSVASLTMKLMRPDATFTMGAPRREPGRRANETERRVKLDQAFYVSLHEVTNAQYRQFNPSHNSTQIMGQSLDLDNYPVVNVSWEDAARFCNWLSAKEGYAPYYKDEGGVLNGVNAHSTGYRLPTELEWAWLARVQKNKTLRYAWGDSFPPDKVIANFRDVSATTLLGNPLMNYQDNYPVASPVGSFPASDKGLFDIGGNVSEWTNDYYDVGKTHLGEPLLNPNGPETGTQRVIRGSSWKMGGRSELRLTQRAFGTNARDDLGFRVVRTVK